MQIDYQITGTGWAAAAISHQESRAELGASYLTDALGDLVAAATLALSTEEEIRFSWELEPGEHRWILTPADGLLRVQILSFRDMDDHQDDEDGRETFGCEVSAPEFAEAVLRGAEHVQGELGLERYREQWVEHDFPQGAVDELGKLLDQRR
ncbi:MAG: hypothetical protein ABI869_00645 [Actinomycetota bacterium]